jgi:hypothetical protein
MRRLLPTFVLFLVLAAPAGAAPRWFEAEPPFANPAEGDASAGMAPDGTVIYARFADDGALEVRERPAGGPVGGVTRLAPVTVKPPSNSHLQVLTSPDGVALVFDAGEVRYASVRAPGAQWTDPSPAAPAGGQAALDPHGRLWLLSRAPDRDDALAVYKFRTDEAPLVTPVPFSGAPQFSPALSVPTPDAAHVAFLERDTQEGEVGWPCTLLSKIREVDVPAAGAPGPVFTLDRFEAHGTVVEGGCALAEGEQAIGPVLIATDAAGADTVAYTRLAANRLTTLARHRARGTAWPAIAWPAEPVATDTIAEKLIGGAGDPVFSGRTGARKVVTTRTPDGAWTEPATLVEFLGTRFYGATRTSAGTTAFAWIDEDELVGRVLAGGALQAPVKIAPATEEDALVALGSDGEGDAVALTSRGIDDRASQHAYGYDAAGPRLTRLDLPDHPVAGAALSFSADGVDVWTGRPAAVFWAFGDGGTGFGFTRAHAYDSSGHRTITVHLTDAAGNLSEATAGLDVGAAPPWPPPVATPGAPAPATPGAPAPPPPAATPADLRAPRLRDVSARAGLVRLTTDEAGTARVELTKRARGVRGRDGRCVRATRRGTACTRTLARRTVTKAIGAGARRIALPLLSVGTWRVRVTVTDAAGNASRPALRTVRAARQEAQGGVLIVGRR